MDGSYSRKLHIWQKAAPTEVDELPEPAHDQAIPGPHHPADFARRLYACEALSPTTAAPSGDEGAEPYTLQWFLNIENHRHSRHGRWIPRLLEFSKHSGETLLGLGNGLGTDWLQYARHGANVVVCSPSAEQLHLTRCNFELRGLSGRFVHALATCLPLEPASIDVACIRSLLHEVPDPRAVVQEVYRVLKPGGKVIVVTPARYDIDFWFHCCFPWQRWLGARRAGVDGGMVRFSGRKLRRLFGPFVEHRVYKRHLRRSEVPHVWRWAPLPLMERLMGRALVLKAFKPLSAAMNLQAAA